MKKAALHNLGCKVNSYEAQGMELMLRNAGYEIVDFENEIADVYIVNTCSVTNIADRKSRQMLHRARKKNKDAVIIAAGCYAQAAPNELLADDSVDIIVGNNKKIDIVKVIDEYLEDKNNNSNVIDIGGTNEYEKLEINQVLEHTRAFIKVQDGCNQFCSYCIIPYTRGRIRSREISDVIEEIKNLAAKGYKEFVLTGIHLSSYGLERQEKAPHLLELIEAVSRVEGVERIRLGSLEPRIVTEEFVSRLAQVSQICPHFHLSLQSGCDATLKRMNRRYNTAEYEEGCNILRRHFEHPAITTDVIVGFPDESDEEFEQTRQFLEKIRFFEMHIFKYSRRKGTVADKLPGQVPDLKKNLRSEVLISLDAKLSDEYREYYLDRICSVLFEEKITMDDEEYYIGHTKTYVKVAVKSKEPLENKVLDVHVTGKLSKDIMQGEI
jgi:threonylcarbamoyladenosine tRNA methylthiotransferase MtaB